MIGRREALPMAAAGLVAVAIAPADPKRVIVNLTPSVPVGVYLTSQQPVTRSAMVLISPGSHAHRMAVARTVVGPGRPLLKIVAAMAGDRVCRHGLAVWINGHIRVWARRSDHVGRWLPVWQGCRVLRSEQVIVLGTHRDSFDSRYFGPVMSQDLVARVHPIWLF